ncbi:hypothetical protein [Pseudomonas sp. FEN]|uniref:hypothetical protein n=1 Tax=Pseudomonas sp. FEN TaxID=2767468 RepID=UPI00174D3E0C|nr:hypothetical protein [Pseudomonas sp. FEN]
MPLGVHEIVAGCVAYLDGEALIADQAVSDPEGVGTIGIRPFLCISTEGGSSKWLTLTTQRSLERVSLWGYQINGPLTWRTTENFVTDARKVFEGPNTSFIAASHSDHASNNRPMVSAAGLVLVLNMVAYYTAQEHYEDDEDVEYLEPQQQYFNPYQQQVFNPYQQQYVYQPQNGNGYIDGTGLWFPPQQ